MDAAVQLTNDFSIVSKYSMVTRGYFNDDFVRFFASKLVRRTPIINLGYFVRAKIIDDVLRHYLSVSSQVQVLSLGAGYDTTFFRLNKNCLSKYVEIDLDYVVSNKAKIIENTPCLRKQVPNLKRLGRILHLDCGITNGNYSLLSQNLNDLLELESKLKAIDFELDSLVVVLTECSITYMEEPKSTRLIQWVAENCPHSVFINYEQIHPDDGFGRVMTNHFVSVGNPIKSVVKYKTVDEQRLRYLSVGFDNCVSVSAMNIVDGALSSQLSQSLALEPFDEWEELHAKCCHYALTVAIKGDSFDFPPYLIHHKLSPTSMLPFSTCGTVRCEFDPERVIQRFGHTIVAVGHESIIFGGFGLLRGSDQHGRVDKMELLGNERSSIVVRGESVTNDCLYAKCVAIDELSFAIYGGRTSPKREVNEQAKIATCQNIENSLTVNFRSVDKCGIPPRWRHSLSFLNGCIVIFGGRNSKMEVFGDLWVYSLYGQMWYSWSADEIQNKQSGPKPRFSHSDAVCSARSEIIVAGGLNHAFKPVNDIYALKIRKQADEHIIAHWARILCIPEMTPRYGHTSHISGNSLVMVGGCNMNSAELPELCIVNLETLVSVEYKIQSSIERPILLHGHTSDLTDSLEIIIYGGGGNCFSFGTFYNSNPIRIKLPDS